MDVWYDPLCKIFLNSGLYKAKDFPDLKVDDQKLCRAQKTKYLGVTIGESMNWEEQLKTVKRKIKNGLGAMFKLKNILSQKQLATVYRALIESHMRYCSVIWGCLSNTKLESLQRLQNRARSVKDRLFVFILHRFWVRASYSLLQKK